MKKRPGELAAKLRPIVQNNLFDRPQPLSPAEALALLLDIGLSEEDYTKLSKELNSKIGCQILPPLYAIRGEKCKCHPEGIQVNDHEVMVGPL